VGATIQIFEVYGDMDGTANVIVDSLRAALGNKILK
jgi:hypothetical protein